jgi:hypothetical protein
MILFPSMPQRPIHRWKTLWLGILVIAFLAWAWRDSTQAEREISYRKYILSHAGSGISIKYTSPTSDRDSPVYWFRRRITLTSSRFWQVPTFEAPVFFRGNGEPWQQDGDPPLPYLDSDFQPRNSAEYHIRELIWPNRPGSIGIFIPHWLPIITFITIWSAFLLWRSRRMNRFPAGRAET